MNVIQEKAMTGRDYYRGSSPHFALRLDKKYF